MYFYLNKYEVSISAIIPQYKNPTTYSSII